MHACHEEDSEALVVTGLAVNVLYMIFHVIYKLRTLITRKSVIKDIDQEALTNFDLIVVVLSFISILLFGISAFADINPEYLRLLLYIDTAFCLLFFIDFVLDFKEAKNKAQFLKWGWIDLLSAVPSIEYFRWGRVFRLFRLLKAISSIRLIMLHSFSVKKNGMITIAFITTVLVIIFSSISILYFENAPESNIKTAEDAIWWTFTTITTVGYGDRFPVTTEGRAVGILTMLVGISVFSIVTAYIASVFIQQQSECKENK